jgi:hypothetical protein
VPIRREPPAGDDTMEMRVMHQGLAPRVQHGDKADRRPEMAGIRRDGAQGVRGRAMWSSSITSPCTVVIGRPGRWPGKSQRRDRLTRHQSRKIASSVGESTTSRSFCPVPCSMCRTIR